MLMYIIKVNFVYAGMYPTYIMHVFFSHLMLGICLPYIHTTAGMTSTVCKLDPFHRNVIYFNHVRHKVS